MKTYILSFTFLEGIKHADRHFSTTVFEKFLFDHVRNL